jgi:biopolymer transport protein ExbB/TolQ
MKKLAGLSEMTIVVAGSLALTLISFSPLFLLEGKNYARQFFLGGGGTLVQATSTFLFFVALFSVFFRHRRLAAEFRDMKYVNIQSLSVVTPDAAQRWLEGIPRKHKDALCYRRISELLRAFLAKEEIIALNEDLSRRDHEQVERGHLFLVVLRELLPIVGFLGTVVGLSMGMMRFPEMVKNLAEVESLKKALQGFAANLSVAFNTTLLALAYTVVVVILVSFLRHREESYISQIDSIARELLAKLRRTGTAIMSAPIDVGRMVEHAGNALGQQMRESLNVFLQQWLQRQEESLDGILAKNGAVEDKMSALVQQHNDRLIEKLEAIRQGIQEPPHYEIRVQPIAGGVA